MAGKIKKLLDNELVGGTQTTDVYPVTSIKAVYDEENERLDNIINRRGVVNISTNYNSDHIAEVLTLEQAIAKVPSKDRVLGFQGKFLSENGWKSYVFIGDSIADWTNKTKWNNYLTGTDIVQESGEAEDKVMSQKAVNDKLGDLVENTIGDDIKKTINQKILSKAVISSSFDNLISNNLGSLTIGYLDSTGKFYPDDSSAFAYAPLIPISYFKQYILNVYDNSSHVNRLYAFYDSNKAIIDGGVAEVGDNTHKTIDFYSKGGKLGATYVSISINKNSQIIVKKRNFNYLVNEQNVFDQNTTCFIKKGTLLKYKITCEASAKTYIDIRNSSDDIKIIVPNVIGNTEGVIEADKDYSNLRINSFGNNSLISIYEFTEQEKDLYYNDYLIENYIGNRTEKTISQKVLTPAVINSLFSDLLSGNTDNFFNGYLPETGKMYLSEDTNFHFIPYIPIELLKNYKITLFNGSSYTNRLFALYDKDKVMLDGGIAEKGDNSLVTHDFYDEWFSKGARYITISTQKNTAVYALPKTNGTILFTNCNGELNTPMLFKKGQFVRFMVKCASTDAIYLALHTNNKVISILDGNVLGDTDGIIQVPEDATYVRYNTNNHDAMIFVEILDESNLYFYLSKINRYKSLHRTILSPWYIGDNNVSESVGGISIIEKELKANLESDSLNEFSIGKCFVVFSADELRNVEATNSIKLSVFSLRNPQRVESKKLLKVGDSVEIDGTETTLTPNYIVDPICIDYDDEKLFVETRSGNNNLGLFVNKQTYSVTNIKHVRCYLEDKEVFGWNAGEIILHEGKYYGVWFIHDKINESNNAGAYLAESSDLYNWSILRKLAERQNDTGCEETSICLHDGIIYFAVRYPSIILGTYNLTTGELQTRTPLSRIIQTRPSLVYYDGFLYLLCNHEADKSVYNGNNIPRSCLCLVKMDTEFNIVDETYINTPLGSNYGKLKAFKQHLLLFNNADFAGNTTDKNTLCRNGIYYSNISDFA